MSRSTVKTNLSHIYAKLRSRTAWNCRPQPDNGRPCRSDGDPVASAGTAWAARRSVVAQPITYSHHRWLAGLDGWCTHS